MSLNIQYHLTNFDNPGKRLAVVQGARYGFTLSYPTIDFTGWTFGGQIRKTYDDATILASWNFGTVTFGTIPEFPTDSFSTFEIYLNASQTAALPIPPKTRESRTDPAVPGSNVWVYDIEAYDPLDAENIIKVICLSYVQVKPEVTR